MEPIPPELQRKIELRKQYEERMLMEQELMMAQGGFPQQNGINAQIMPAPGVGAPDGMAPLRMNMP